MTNAHTGIGTLEVEAVVRRADGTIKSTEKITKPVAFRLDQNGSQITHITEV